MRIEEIITRGQVVTVQTAPSLKLAAQLLVPHRISCANLVAGYSELTCTHEHAAVTAAETRR